MTAAGAVHVYEPAGGAARPVLLAAIAYALASVLLTWPLAIHPSTLLFGDFGDTRGRAWLLWAKVHGYLDGKVDLLTAAPFGAPVMHVIAQPFYEWPAEVLASAWGEIVAINILTLAAFPLTAISTFLLLRRLLLDDAAAFFGGLVFGFCPAAVLQSVAGHGEYAFNVFVPLFLLALLSNRARRTTASAAVAGAAFAAVTLTSLYTGFFCALFAMFFVAFDAAASWPLAARRFAWNYLKVACIAALLLLPFEFDALYHLFAESGGNMEKAGYVRDAGQLVVFSARYWNYLVPSLDHPVFGRFVADFVRTHVYDNVFEHTLYLGMVPLGLLVAGVVLYVRRTLDEQYRASFVLFTAAAAWMFLVSLPPRIGGGIPGVSYFTYLVAPMFRVYARAGIVANLLVACAAAVALSALSRRRAGASRRGLVAVCCVLLTFEYWSIPPEYALNVSVVPEVYRWLANEPSTDIVAEYPMVPYDEAASYTYQFWQRVHAHPLVNGASPANIRAWDLYLSVRELSNPNVPAILKSVGVRYVIVHRAMYGDGPIPSLLKRYYTPARANAQYDAGRLPSIPVGLHFERAFDDDLVFTVE